MGLVFDIATQVLCGVADRHRLGGGGRHLVVGHSNTVPELVALLGGDGGPPIDEAGEYDRLYVVTLTANGRVRSELRHYGVRFNP